MGPKTAIIITFILLLLFVVAETLTINHFLGDGYLPLTMLVAFGAGYFGTDVQRFLMGLGKK
jgi:hypothetical protein